MNIFKPQLYGIQENYLSDFSLSFKKINQEGQGERSLAQRGCVLLALGALERMMFLTLDLLFDLLTEMLR